MKIKIVRIDKTLPLPEYKTEGAVAFDLYSREKKDIPKGEIAMLPSNFIIEVPTGYCLILASRSGTFKKGLRMANGIGIIDQDYHGPGDELKIVVQNFSNETVIVERGERIAQGILVPILRPEWEEAEVIKETSRGGFGTTGNLKQKAPGYRGLSLHPLLKGT
jgi:dUTP pyrophosphatase